VLPTRIGPRPVIRGVSLDVWRGETLGVVGESGSGKSITFRAVMGLAALKGAIVTGQVMFGGRELVGLDQRALRGLRGREVSLVFQDPLSSLNPVLTVEDQIAEVLRAHTAGLSRRDARRRTIEALELVHIPNAGRRAGDYPHQFSGGMRQRVLIAMAIVCRPRLLIADEPTTALDVTIQAQILELLDSLRRELDMALVLITHDLGVVARHADRVAVMYAGQIVEDGGVEDIYYRPRHPYTKALLDSVPRPGAGRTARLRSIAGEPPTVYNQPSGCAFHPRCALSKGRARCAEEMPDLQPVADQGQLARCHYSEELALSEDAAGHGVESA
jgi:oligopeptide/dipeptide ABC transporter ATP-binding protein